ncbi:MAG: ERF family protein [Desulfovibrio sp.]|uniref:ERF family protein n=1 Tax=Desulfovibrio sp. TaxID=885 RepID=UPI001A6849E0|nr:ERF family protein [Desulfovibrio sp.]MBD5418351.1 ERF family protein [Desulfovibrio sp.]
MQSDCSQEIKELAKALLNVQRQLQPASKDATNPFTKSKYATLNSVMAASRDVLLENGIWLCQYPVPVETEGCIGLATKLTHVESGQWQSSLAVVPLPKADPQGMGSALTYARRYALTAMLGMVTEDDDGEAASGRKGSSSRQPSPRRQAGNRQEPASAHRHETDDLPALDGVTYQRMASQDGRECIVASGNTQPKKEILSGLGFRWNAQRKCWWKYADAV